MRPLLDPRLASSLDNFNPARCTIQSVNITSSVAGQKTEGTPTDVLGRVGLSCRIGPMVLIRPTDNENRTNRIQSAYQGRHLKFNGYYPDITVRAHQAVVDGIVYKIRGVEHDGAPFSTRLRLEILNP